jgi:DNA ligase (NAD+)
MNEKESINYLKKLDNDYYNTGTSELSDVEYDELKEKTRSQYPRNKYFKEVGAKIKKNKVQLPYVLGSLKKYKPENIIEWIEKYPDNTNILISEKLDGLSVYSKFKDGKLIKAITRGNGEVGQDITHKFKDYCCGDFTGELRGEILTLNDDYKIHGYKTRRHFASAIIADEYSTFDHLLHVKQYEWIDSPLKSQYESLELLSSYGFNTPLFLIYYVYVLKEDLQYLNYIIKNSKETKDYDIDGLVLSVDDKERENVKYPKHKISYKVNDEKGIKTTLKNIKWETTRTGNVVPVAEIEPVIVDGVEISNVTLYNYKYVLDNSIYPGCNVWVIRSNDVIPKIIRIKSDEENFYSHYIFPGKCQSCGNNLKTKGVHLYCDNKNCSAQTFGQLSNFIRHLEVENISEQTLINLNISTIEELITITKNDIISKEGFGEKSAEIIINEIYSKILTEVEDYKLLASFGISNLSQETAKKICNKLDNFEDIFKMKENFYLSIDGIGNKLSKVFSNEIPNYIETYYFLKNNGLSIKNKEIISNNILINNKIFTLTGKCEKMGRKELEKNISDLGGIVKGISKNTNFLVTDDLNSSSSKMKKAKSLNIDIIEYEELFKMIEEI